MCADTDTRAERLRVALMICSGMPYLDPFEAADSGLTPLSPSDLLVLAEPLTDEDIALINACVEVEQELRLRTYAAVERVLAIIAGKPWLWRERVLALPATAAMRAICDLSETGWIYSAPKEWADTDA